MTTSSLQDYEVVGLAAAKSTCLNSPTNPGSCRSPKVLSAPRLPTTSAHAASGFRQKVWQGGGPPALLPRCKRTLPGIFPGSLLRFGSNLPPLKVLPVELPISPLPVGVMTLKNQTISLVAQLFIKCARELTKPLVRRGQLRARR
jgi:hypothetical protein